MRKETTTLPKVPRVVSLRYYPVLPLMRPKLSGNDEFINVSTVARNDVDGDEVPAGMIQNCASEVRWLKAVWVSLSKVERFWMWCRSLISSESDVRQDQGQEEQEERIN